MRETVFCDTSALYSFINRKDPDHYAVTQAVSSCRGKLVISNYIVDEIVTLVTARLGHKAAVHIGNVLLGSGQIDRAWITQADEENAWSLFCERADKRYSFTDCTSFVLMRRLGLRKYIALDDHFRQEGFISFIGR